MYEQDQADELRRLATQTKSERFPNAKAPARIIAVTSGKGGVGKSNFVANLAMALTDYNKKVMIIDADLGLANIDVLLGILPKYNIQHVMTGTKTISEVVVTGPKGIKIIPAASGVRELANLNFDQTEEIIARFNELDDDVDVLLIDTSAGLSWNVLSFVLAAQEVIIVTTPDPTAITDAYAMIKVIAKETAGKDISVKLVVNQVNNQKEATEIVEKINNVAHKFLNITVGNLGYIYADPNVGRAVKQQKPFVTTYPYSPATNCVNIIAARLCRNKEDFLPGADTESFFRRMVSLIQRR